MALGSASTPDLPPTVFTTGKKDWPIDVCYELFSAGTGGTNVRPITSNPVTRNTMKTIIKTFTKATNVWEAVLQTLTASGVSVSVTRGSSDHGDLVTTWLVILFPLESRLDLPQNVTSMPEPPTLQNQTIFCSGSQECFRHDMNMVCG